MERYFNTAGPCRPDLHYMLPPEDRLPGVRRLIEQQLYFTLHAPRQTGKTTCIRTLAEALTREGRYAALQASCERGQTARSDVEAGVNAVLRAIEHAARVGLPAELRPPLDAVRGIEPESRLARLLSLWAEGCPRPVVLFLDEIDALLDESLLSVLRQIRSGYPDRPHAFPSSIALVGLKDVRDYKVQLRPERESLGTASPFNIKAESLNLRDFTEDEVRSLLAQHSEETGQAFGDSEMARIFELTQGQPWLVNALARQITEKLLLDRSLPILPEHVELAAEQIIEARATHLDSLVDKLRQPRVRRVLEPILVGDLVLGDTLDEDAAFVRDLGLVARGVDGTLRIANPIYQAVIPRALSFMTQQTIPLQRAWFVDDDGRLDMGRLLAAFARFWMEHAEVLLQHQPYPEAAPHLVLLAFLQRVVNGGGHIEREYAVGMGRMDLLIRWPTPAGEQREALEIKVWRDRRRDPLPAGLDQLAGYLKRLGLSEGTLVLFDRRSSAAEPEQRTSIEPVQHKGYAIRVLRA